MVHISCSTFCYVCYFATAVACWLYILQLYKVMNEQGGGGTNKQWGEDEPTKFETDRQKHRQTDTQRFM